MKSVALRVLTWFWAIFVFLHPVAAQKILTPEDVVSEKFRVRRFDDYKFFDDHRMVKGEFIHGTYFINLYDLTKWEKERTLFSTASRSGISYVWNFEISPNLKYLLLASEIRPGFRRSFAARYYLYDLAQDSLMPFASDFIQIPAFTPGGDTVVYFKNNNLYFRALPDGPETPVTADGRKNLIINGKTDWLYEEEFGFVKAYAISPDGRYLAYIRFDLHKVPDYTLTFYDTEPYPRTYTYKYPKAGNPNSLTELRIFDFKTGQTLTVKPDSSEYMPFIGVGHRADEFLIMTLNRLQNRLRLYAVNGKGNIHKLAEQTDSKYVDFERIRTIHPIDGNRFLWLSEQDGFNRIYMFDRKGGKPRPLTPPGMEITKFYGYDAKSGKIFFQYADSTGFERIVAVKSLKNSRIRRLSPATGYHAADFSPAYSFMLLTSSSLEAPPVTRLYRLRGPKNRLRLIKVLVENDKLKSLLARYEPVRKKYLRLPAADGTTLLNALEYISPSSQTGRPGALLVYQYNGPGVQTVLNRWGGFTDMYHRMMAQHGINVLQVDTRGTGGRGKDFRQITYKHLGKIEIRDLESAVRAYQSRTGISPDRTAVWGWSYGGYTAALALLKTSGVFGAAVSVAPVTDWRFYDTAYTERYMQRPQDNPDGYEEASVLSYAEFLDKPLLLIHGTADDNVHVQHTYVLARTLQNEGKIFDLHVYPDKNHGLYGGKTRLQLYSLMKDFVLSRLKP